MWHLAAMQILQHDCNGTADGHGQRWRLTALLPPVPVLLVALTFVAVVTTASAQVVNTCTVNTQGCNPGFPGPAPCICKGTCCDDSQDCDQYCGCGGGKCVTWY